MLIAISLNVRFCIVSFSLSFFPQFYPIRKFSLIRPCLEIRTNWAFCNLFGSLVRGHKLTVLLSIAAFRSTCFNNKNQQGLFQNLHFQNLSLYIIGYKIARENIIGPSKMGKFLVCVQHRI